MIVRKKPIVLSFRRAVNAELIQTLEGAVTALPGDAILTGTKGESWPVKSTTFQDTYVSNDVDGTCYKRAIDVVATQMSEPFEVVVGWSAEPLKGSPGDYKLEYGPGDYGIVRADIFDETYEVVA